uniref:uncharacterized protein LOC122608208 n=1 Tax=Erigeron canadensis TaxID=72917 RepID=UPI001CB98E8F|nr:uncharacterized protein LOC122608208 [Erigeron canadensis]
MSENIINTDNNNKGSRNNRGNNKNEQDLRLWKLLFFGIIGATFAVGQLRWTVDWFYSQFKMSESTVKGAASGFSQSGFHSEARRRYAYRLKKEYEEELERVERVRRMQRMFNKEKNKYRRGYERWREGGYSESYQRDDWYWKTDTTYGNWSNFREPTRSPVNYSLSHHYAILGLSRSRTTPYTDDEIKTAFRSKAKQYHPDQNQENKDIAEARFREIMTSYEAIKSERKNSR